MQLSDLVRIFPGVIDPATCSQLTTGFDERSEHHVRHDDGGFQFTELNITQHWPEAHEAVFRALVPQFEAYSRDLAIGPHQWPDELAFEELRIKRYEAGRDEFPEHVDVMDHPSARRFLAALLWLNDVRDGGETDFPLWRQALKPSAGSLLLFPPLWPWLHAGRRPLSGPKYILTTYLHYV